MLIGYTFVWHTYCGVFIIGCCGTVFPMSKIMYVTK